MKKKSPWSRNDKLAAAGVAIALVACASAFFIPEVRQFFGLEKLSTLQTPVQVQTSTAPVSPSQSAPSTLAPTPPTSTTTQHAQTTQHAKPQQDNSVHIGDHANVSQSSTGDCSPNIIGGSPTVNCGNEGEVEAERIERLKLQAALALRRLSLQQKELLVRRVSAFTSKSIFISCVNGGTETRDFAQDFVEAFSTPSLTFNVEHATCAQIMAAGFSPAPVQVDAGTDRQEDANTLVKALIEIGVNSASITRRSNDNKAILALTIGPKPTI